jgi:hypothetical protein
MHRSCRFLQWFWPTRDPPSISTSRRLLFRFSSRDDSASSYFMLCSPESLEDGMGYCSYRVTVLPLSIDYSHVMDSILMFLASLLKFFHECFETYWMEVGSTVGRLMYRYLLTYYTYVLDVCVSTICTLRTVVLVDVRVLSRDISIIKCCLKRLIGQVQIRVCTISCT